MKKYSLMMMAIASLAVALFLAACGADNSANSSGAVQGDTPASTAPADEPATTPATTPAADPATAPAANPTTEPTTKPTEPAAVPAAAPAKPAFDGAPYGYAGTDPIEFAVSKYVVDELSAFYDKGEVCLPVVKIIYTDKSNPDEVLVYGDFWVQNFKIDGKTLVYVNGGNFPGVMHLKKNGELYTVTAFDRTEEARAFTESAKKLFGDHADALFAFHSDDAAKKQVREQAISDYIKLNNLDVTQYQDYGQDPVKLG